MGFLEQLSSVLLLYPELMVSGTCWLRRVKPGVTNSVALPTKFCVSRIICEGVLTVEKPALLKRSAGWASQTRLGVILKDPRTGAEISPKVFILDHHLLFCCWSGNNPCQKSEALQ